MTGKALIATGRIVTGVFFVLAGLNKTANASITTASMKAAGLFGELLPLVIALEVVGGLVIIIGRGSRVFIATAIALAAFTLATNAVFHRFWALEDPMRTLELSLFFKNLVIAGALVSFAGWKLSQTTA